MTQGPSRARGSPPPRAPTRGPRPLNLLCPEREAPDVGSGRASVRGLRPAPRARLLAPFSFWKHKPAHAPAGATRDQGHRNCDPYRPRAPRRKPRPIRAFRRASRTRRLRQWGPGRGGASARAGGGLRAPPAGGEGALGARERHLRTLSCRRRPVWREALGTCLLCFFFVFLVFTPPDRGGNYRQVRSLAPLPKKKPKGTAVRYIKPSPPAARAVHKGVISRLGFFFKSTTKISTMWA